MGVFFHQSDIISNSTNGDIFLKTPFAWPQSLSNKNEVTNVEPRAVEFSQVEEREMYVSNLLLSQSSSQIHNAR